MNLEAVQADTEHKISKAPGTVQVSPNWGKWLKDCFRAKEKSVDYFHGYLIGRQFYSIKISHGRRGILTFPDKN